MLIKETVTYLEMTSRDQLVPGREPPAPLELERIEPEAAPLVRVTYSRIAAPYGWISRSNWTDKDWGELLSRPGVQAWLARAGGETAGMVELVPLSGEVEIAVLGLVPQFVGRGFGGHLLTVATQLAWGTKSPDGVPAHRVWLHTSSRDHVHAKRNYERRGFRPFRTEHREREVPVPGL
jgi:GNAT superfamily N-acetyltransferase